MMAVLTSSALQEHQQQGASAASHHTSDSNAHHIETRARGSSTSSAASSATSSAMVVAPYPRADHPHDKRAWAQQHKPCIDVTSCAALCGLHSPTAGTASVSFDGICSPRQPNGKRYLGGYLQQRVLVAGGLIKSWKRKYFRLREHGLVCYRQQEDATTAQFVLQFQATTRLQIERYPAGPGTAQAHIHPHSTDRKMPHSNSHSASSSSSSLVFVLHDVKVEGHELAASRVDLPVFLKAENESQFSAWIENLRMQLESWQRVVAPAPGPGLETGTPKEHAAITAMQHGRELPATSTCDKSKSEMEPDDSRLECSTNVDPREVSVVLSESTLDESSTLSIAPKGSTATTSMCSVLSSPDPSMTSNDRFDASYLLMKEIGEGSFSIVHRAVNRLNGSMYAVKCCRNSNILDEEVRLLRKLSHPNLIGLEAVYHEDEMAYVVMDLMQDGDLCERLLQRQHLQEEDARIVTIQVLHGLDYLHRHHIMHRDIKPENILLHGNLVKLADFGLAKQLPTSTSLLTRSCGTLEYAAPELLCGRPYGLKSDIFSLGIVLYVLLFGAFPFSIESAAALQRRERFADGIDERDMSCLHPESPQWRFVSPQAQDVLLRMLCVDEHERVSATALLQHPWFHPKTSSLRSMQSLHTMAEQEQRRRRACLEQGVRELLARGLQVVKWSKNGTAAPHTTTLTVDTTQQTISWTRNGILHCSDPSSSASRSTGGRCRVLGMSDIQEIRSGCTTTAFKTLLGGSISSNKSTKHNAREDCCFSIVSTRRTLDLVAATRTQRDMLVQGLISILAETTQPTK